MNVMPFREALSLAQLKDKTPSVFAKHASSKMSESYSFVPSTLVIDTLEKLGMVPVQANQRNAKGDETVARHLIRFALTEDIGKARESKDLTTEVVMVNSHNGRTAFKLYYGLYRLICGNGLVVSEATVGMTRRHIGDVKAIISELNNVLEQGPKVITLIKAMKKLKLSDSDRLDLARHALALRYEEKIERGKPTVKPTILADQLIIPRRREDNGTDLWSTFNVIQENLVSGGITGKSANGRATHTRLLQDVRKVVSVNTGLWELAAAKVSKTKVAVAA